jgi:hypothetical protein
MRETVGSVFYGNRNWDYNNYSMKSRLLEKGECIGDLKAGGKNE